MSMETNNNEIRINNWIRQHSKIPAGKHGDIDISGVNKEDLIEKLTTLYGRTLDVTEQEELYNVVGNKLDAKELGKLIDSVRKKIFIKPEKKSNNKEFQSLIADLKNGFYYSDRLAAASKLGDLGNLSAIEPLKHLLKNEKYQFLLIEAALALGKLGDNSGEELLINSLKSPAMDVPCKAAEALGKLGYRSAIEPLKNLLSNPEDYSCISAAKALYQLGDNSGISLLVSIAQNTETRVRLSAIEALGDLRISSAVNDLGSILMFERGTEYAACGPNEVSVHTIDALFKIAKSGNDLAVDHLISASCKGNRYAVFTLKSIGGTAVKKAVKALIRDFNKPKGHPYDPYHFRSSIPWALSALEDLSAVEPLKNALKNNDGNLYELIEVAKALFELGDNSGSEFLKGLLKNSKERDTRCNVAEALGDIGDHSAVSILRDSLKTTDDPILRFIICSALGNLRDTSSIPDLKGVLKNDPNSTVREDAARALGQIGDRSAEDQLKHSKKHDPDSRVRSEANNALRFIKQKNSTLNRSK